jgi:hypothetical protein
VERKQEQAAEQVATVQLIRQARLARLAARLA